MQIHVFHPSYCGTGWLLNFNTGFIMMQFSVSLWISFAINQVIIKCYYVKKSKVIYVNYCCWSLSFKCKHVHVEFQSVTQYWMLIWTYRQTRFDSTKQGSKIIIYDLNCAHSIFNVNLLKIHRRFSSNVTIAILIFERRSIKDSTITTVWMIYFDLISHWKIDTM